MIISVERSMDSNHRSHAGVDAPVRAAADRVNVCGGVGQSNDGDGGPRRAVDLPRFEGAKRRGQDRVVAGRRLEHRNLLVRSVRVRRAALVAGRGRRIFSLAVSRLSGIALICNPRR